MRSTVPLITALLMLSACGEAIEAQNQPIAAQQVQNEVTDATNATGAGEPRELKLQDPVALD